MCPLQSIPVTYTRDRCAYVVDLTLYVVESTAFGRQGPEVQILSPRPLTDWFITLSTVYNVISTTYALRSRVYVTAYNSNTLEWTNVGHILVTVKGYPTPICILLL